LQKASLGAPLYQRAMQLAIENVCFAINRVLYAFFSTIWTLKVLNSLDVGLVARPKAAA
jgi:hypothetical protein